MTKPDYIIDVVWLYNNLEPDDLWLIGSVFSSWALFLILLLHNSLPDQQTPK